MDASFIQTALHAAGLDSFLPVLLAVHALASAMDAIVPQPAPGSHWLPLRKIVSFAAGNVRYATNAMQPATITWVQRVAGILVAMLPPAAAAATPAAAAPVGVVPPQRIDPTVFAVQAAQSAVTAGLSAAASGLFPPLPINPQP